MPRTTMTMLPLLLILLAPAPGEPQRRDDARAAFEGRRAGHLMPLPEIERRIVPQMKGAQYLGFDFDGTAVYTLKFLRNGAVIWVDVDGRTGQVIGRTGR